MKQVVRFGLGIAIAISTCVIAGPVTIPNSFSAGTPARAAEVNANFNAVATAVNDNDSRLTTLETQATRPDVAPSGNLALGKSTAMSGNISKDAVPFLHDFGIQNTFLGSRAGNFWVTGQANTGVGYDALTQVTAGTANSSFGTTALRSNTTGSDNTAIGTAALFWNETGSGNTVIGAGAMIANLAGGENTAVGNAALRSATSRSAKTHSSHSRKAIGTPRSARPPASISLSATTMSTSPMAA
jgi:hypothetical protein